MAHLGKAIGDAFPVSVTVIVDGQIDEVGDALPSTFIALFFHLTDARGSPSNGGAVNLEQRQGLINILLGEGTGDVKGFQVVLEFTAACNIKCERTNTTSNDGYAFYRIYFFTINRAKTQ